MTRRVVEAADEGRRGMTLRTLLVLIAAVAVVVDYFFGGPLFYLAAGWAYFVARVGPRITVSVGGLFTALAAVTLFVAGLHMALRWLYGTAEPAVTDAPGRWRPKWTATVSALVLVAFASGIAALGVVHQLGWLATAPEPLMQGGMREVASRVKTTNNLKQVAFAVDSYPAVHVYLPPGYTIDAFGQPLHGWQTAILPYVECDRILRQI